MYRPFLYNIQTNRNKNRAMNLIFISEKEEQDGNIEQ